MQNSLRYWKAIVRARSLTWIFIAEICTCEAEAVVRRPSQAQLCVWQESASESISSMNCTTKSTSLCLYMFSRLKLVSKKEISKPWAAAADGGGTAWKAAASAVEAAARTLAATRVGADEAGTAWKAAASAVEAAARTLAATRVV